MSTQTKLPAGLPKLPPVPDGYSRWMPLGCGARTEERGCIAFIEYPGPNTGWDVRAESSCQGIEELFYLVAVRDAKPAKKAKRVKVRARVMFTCGENNVTVPIERAKYYSGPYPVSPVLVLPFDAASREVIVEAAAQAVWGKIDTLPRGVTDDSIARAVLSTLHPDFAKEGR